MTLGEPGVIHHPGRKFDLQLAEGLVRERKLADIFSAAKLELIELKSENYQWEKTGNICVEYRSRGKPSGIAVTAADYWVHELRRGDDTLVYLMFPVARLKELAREAMRAGRFRHGAGDDAEQSVVLIKLADILR